MFSSNWKETVGELIGSNYKCIWGQKASSQGKPQDYPEVNIKKPIPLKQLLQMRLY